MMTDSLTLLSSVENDPSAAVAGDTGNCRTAWLPSSISDHECTGCGSQTPVYSSSGVTITRMSAGHIKNRVKCRQRCTIKHETINSAHSGREQLPPRRQYRRRKHRSNAHPYTTTAAESCTATALINRWLKRVMSSVIFLTQIKREL